MTVENTSWQVTHAGDGSTKDFPVPFMFLSSSDLLVIVTDSTGTEYTKTLFTDYTVTGAGDEEGGSVHMLTAPATSEDLDVYRIPSLLQSADLEHNDSLPSTTLERMSDLLTMSVQHLHTLMKRTLRFSYKDGEIDERRIEDAKGKYPFFNSSGDLTFVTGDPSQPVSHDVSFVYPTTGQTVIPVSAGYTPGSFNLSVYLNGEKLVYGDEYAETSSSSITLVTGATTGDVIELGIGEVYDVTVARPSRQEHPVLTGLTGNTLTLTSLTYTPGGGEIDIFMNGSRLRTYTETNSTTITLPFNLISTDEVVVLVGRVLDTVIVQDYSITPIKLVDVLDLSAKTITLPAASVSASNLAATMDLSAKTVTLPATSVTNAMLSLSANASAIKTAINASGSAPIFACRAWGNMNGTGSPAYRASGNMSATIIDNGVGDWTVAFDASMPDANYAVSVNGYQSTYPNDGRTFMAKNLTAAGFTIHCVYSADGITEFDADYISFAVFR